MALSKELQQGKAAEHLVCADLILQGYSAFLADAGLPYDVILDNDGCLYRLQVKSTNKEIRTPKAPNGIYRFQMRTAKKKTRRISCSQVDVIAFVALDKRVIAYLPAHMMVTLRGDMKITMEFNSDSETRGKSIYGFSEFPLVEKLEINQPDFEPVRQFMHKGRQYRLVSPDGQEFVVDKLADFCREHNLNLTGLMNVASGRSSNSAGWGCQRLFKKGQIKVCVTEPS